MGVSKLDKLIEAEVGPPVYAHLTQERLNGRTFGAYLFNGGLMWWDLTPSDTDPLPSGARPLFVRDGDRG